MIPNRYSAPTLVFAATAAITAITTFKASAQPADQTPPELQGVGVTEHLDEQIPLGLEFTDEEGRKIKLGDYFQGDRPVILTLNYYRCPMLCSLQLNGLIEGLKELEWSPGQDFEIVTVSIDPTETPSLAKAKKKTYMEEYGRPSAAAGWHFLTGSKKNINELASAVGFHFKWNPDRREWMHAAALSACTPEGHISRYLYGVMYEPKTLRLALLEASQGKIGSTIDQIILYCYHYDAKAGSYSLAAFNLMRAGGAMTAVIIGGILVALWRRELRKKKTAAAD